MRLWNWGSREIFVFSGISGNSRIAGSGLYLVLGRIPNKNGVSTELLEFWGNTPNPQFHHLTIITYTIPVYASWRKQRSDKLRVESSWFYLDICRSQTLVNIYDIKRTPTWGLLVSLLLECCCSRVSRSYNYLLFIKMSSRKAIDFRDFLSLNCFQKSAVVCLMNSADSTHKQLKPLFYFVDHRFNRDIARHVKPNNT